MELVEDHILRLASRLALWLDTFFSGALEARIRLWLAHCRLERVLREHGEDSEIGRRAAEGTADAQFAAEYWMDGSERLRSEIDIALSSGVDPVDLRLLSLNKVLLVKEGELSVATGCSLRSLTPFVILVCVLTCVALTALTALSEVAHRHKIAIMSLLVAALVYLLGKWRQRRSMISGARRRVVEYLEHRGPVPNVSQLPRKWPHILAMPARHPPLAKSPQRPRYRNIQD
jgi:hypothetical protein